jgi:chromosome partitioning protein
MIVSIQNQKGGVGKTTLAVHLAFGLSGKNHVLLVDADPQGSARDWAASRKDNLPFDLVAMDRPILHRDLPSLAKDYAYVIIDGPPRVSEIARSAILASDLVLIPIQPSPYDLWAAQETVKLVREASLFKENLKSAFIINRKIVNTVIAREIVEALKDYEIPVLKNTIAQRIAFAESAATGKTVLEIDAAGPAALEISHLLEELFDVKENHP